jgi:hypothetical protein
MNLKISCELAATVARYREVGYLIEELEDKVKKLKDRHSVLFDKMASDYQKLRREPGFDRLAVIDEIGVGLDLAALEKRAKEDDARQVSFASSIPHPKE